MASPFSSSVVASSRAQLAEIFCETPVDLTTFVQDPAYLNNPPLSPIQYDAVRHIEQILSPETYELMRGVWGEYWKPKRFINYATLVFGKGCILPYEKVYDPVSGRWDSVGSLTSEGYVSCYDSETSSFKTRPRTSAYQHGYGSCVRVELTNGYTVDVYEGHKFLVAGGKWKEARYLTAKDSVAVASSLSCEQPVRVDDDVLEFVACLVGRGMFADSSFHVRRTRFNYTYKKYVGLLEKLGESKLFLQPFWSYLEFTTLFPESFSKLQAIASSVGIDSLEEPVTQLPDFVFSLPDDQLAKFLYHVWSFSGATGKVLSKSSGNRGFLLGTAFRFNFKSLARDMQRLLLRVSCPSKLTWYNHHLDDPFFGQKKSSTSSQTQWSVNFNMANDTARFLDTLLSYAPEDEKLKDLRSKCFTNSEFLFPPTVKHYKVSSIQSLGMEEYWNLTVPDGGNYVASGFVNANSGKDHLSRVASLRVVYLLQCLHDPQNYFGMPSQDTIHLLNVASARAQATRAYFTPLTKLVRSSPWFANKCDVKQDMIVWEKNIEMISGHSEAESQEGLNLLLGVADELDGFKSKDAPGARARDFVNSAETIIDMLHTSSRTRFPEAFKVVHISYPRYVGSPILKLLERGKQDQEEMGEESRYYTSGPYATWEVHPNRKKSYFADDYKKDPLMARTKYECKPERAIDPYFRNFQAIKSCMRADDSPLTLNYSLGNESGAPVWRVDHDFGTMVPKPGALYILHADLALRHDRAGLAMVHVLDWQEVSSITTDEDGAETELWESRPNVYVDFAIGYEADLSQKPEREIQIRWVRQLVLELRRRGFNIALVSYDQFQCLSGDTSISLLDGREVPIKELAETHPEGGFWVYSVNKDGRIVPGKVTKAWKTGTRSDMVTVTLDNSETVTCTSDHLFMLRDGSYKEAGLLAEGDSLMPLYRRTRKISPTSREYEQVHHPEAAVGQSRWQYTHSMSAGAVHRPADKGEVVHHVDLSSTNNSPDNLQIMSSSDHSALHSRLASGRFEKLWSDPEWAEAHKKRISASLSERQSGLRGKNTNRYKQDLTWELVEEAVTSLLEQGLTIGLREVAAELGCSRTTVIARAREHGYNQWREYKDYRNPPSYNAMKSRRWRSKQAVYNHKVVSVVPAPTQDVYDISVDEHHNFAVSSGVVVHNSADSMQILHTQGIRTKKVSADRDDSVWRNLRDLMYEGRISLPNSKMLYEELTALMKMPNGKVDHPASSGKDLADAVACAALSAVSIGGAETKEESDIVFETASVYDSYPIGFPETSSGMDLYSIGGFSRYNG